MQPLSPIMSPKRRGTQPLMSGADFGLNFMPNMAEINDNELINAHIDSKTGGMNHMMNTGSVQQMFSNQEHRSTPKV